MADFFGDLSDNEEEEIIEQSNAVQTVEEPEGYLNWLKKDDSDDDGSEGGNARILSHQEKAMKAVNDICDKFDFVDFDEEASWKLANDLLVQSAELSHKYLKKYERLPKQFAILIDTIKNAVEERKEAQFEDKGAKKHFIAVAKKIEQVNQDFSNAKVEGDSDSDAEDGDDSGDDEEVVAGKSKDWSVEKMIEALTPGFKRGRRFSSTCKQIMVNAKEKRLPHIEIAAAAQHCAALLDEARSVGISSSAWKRAYNSLIRSVTLAQTVQGVSVSDKECEITPKRTCVVGGWAPLAQSLYGAIVRACQHGDYVPISERIIDEAFAASALDHCLSFYLKTGKKSAIAQCAFTLLEILHVRGNIAHDALNAAVPKHHVLTMPIGTAVQTLYDLVMDNGNDNASKDMATLAYVYSLALTNNFYDARDAFLRFNIQPSAAEDDEDLLVRYNRVIAQLGLCAFRNGYFNESHAILGDLCAKNGRELRELLGQVDLIRTFRRNDDDDIKKTAAELARLVPPHHALPVTVIEHSHLVLAMANDILIEAKNPEERPQRSKQFFSLCKRRQNVLMSGPPTDDLERIYAAYEALQVGDIDTALAMVEAITSWGLLPDDCNAIPLLKAKLRVDGLKVFLISRGQHYASLTVDELATRFGLSSDDVKSTVSRLLLDHTLTGHWSEDDSHMVIERGPQSRLHHLSRECCDRVAQFAAFNDNAGGQGQGRGGRGNMWGGGPRGGRGGGGRGAGGRGGAQSSH